MEQKIKMISFEDVPEYTGLEKNSASITVKDGHTWDGHRYGTWVGRIYQDDEIKSGFYEDTKNNNTDIFDKLRKDMKLFEKHVTCIRGEDRNTLQCAVDYYIPYMVENHCSTKPTVIDTCIDFCNNVNYEMEYEILLVADEEFRRYITISYGTSGSFASTFFDQMGDIEEMFEAWFEEGEYDFRKVDGNMQVAFYDETGEKTFIDISCMRELLGMINSVRVIKCDRTIIEKDK